MTPIAIGTRGSPLAQAQARMMRDALKKAWPNRTFEIHIIRTQGDRLAERVTSAIAHVGKGLFTSELEHALRKKKIDVAVHSLKDLPTDETPGLRIACVPERADARDVLITRGARTFAELPRGGQVATGSPRRAAQLLAARPDLRVVDIRGNIDSRLRKFREHDDWSALLLAAAGLARLRPKLEGLCVEPIPFEAMLPAPGQGALALQTCDDAVDAMNLLSSLHHAPSAACVQAERTFLRALGGGCLEPIAAYAQPAGKNLLRIDAVAWLFGESNSRRAAMTGPDSDPDRLGVELAVEISR